MDSGEGLCLPRTFFEFFEGLFYSSISLGVDPTLNKDNAGV